MSRVFFVRLKGKNESLLLYNIHEGDLEYQLSHLSLRLFGLLNVNMWKPKIDIAQSIKEVPQDRGFHT